MCGIFGIIFHRGMQQPTLRDAVGTMFSSMAVLSADRGVDSVGMATVFNNGSGLIYKEADDSYTVVRRRAWHRFREYLAPDLQVLIGHTRHATHGPKTLANAHPFEFRHRKLGMLFGAHNGVIRNSDKFGPAPAFLCDSANVLWALAQDPVSAWPSTLRALEGSFALAMARGRSVFLTRNAQSPCYLANLPEVNATAFASTQHTLYAAAALAGLKVHDVRELLTERLYEWQGPELSITFYGMSSYPHEVHSTVNGKDVITRPLAENVIRSHYWCAHCQRMSDYTAHRMVNGRAMCDGCFVKLEESDAMRAAFKAMEAQHIETLHELNGKLCSHGCLTEYCQTCTRTNQTVAAHYGDS